MAQEKESSLKPSSSLGAGAFVLLSLYGAVFVAGFLVLLQWGHVTFTTPPETLLSVRLAVYGAGFFMLAACLWGAAALRIFAGRTDTLNEAAPLLRLAWWSTVIAVWVGGGLLLATVWENAQVLELPHVGLNNLYQVSLLFLVMAGALGTYYARGPARAVTGMFLAPVLAVGSVFWVWLGTLGQAGPKELIPALQSVWLPWHVLANFVGYGSFAVAGAAGMAVLWAPALVRGGDAPQVLRRQEVRSVALDVMNRAITFGLPVFAIAVFLGCVWANEAWGNYWSWDPKETWALIVWLVYAGFLHARKAKLLSERGLAWWAVLGFWITLFCYVGVNMWLGGMHSYGAIVQ